MNESKNIKKNLEEKEKEKEKTKEQDIYIYYKLHEHIITKCQSIYRRRLSCRNNIYIKFKKQQLQFNAVITGYHIINKSPIKEAVWEEINCEIVSNVCIITDKSNGNHISGKDNRFDKFNISNKTTKKEKDNNISISSYRLTSVCNDKLLGNSKDIIIEIEKRDKSFDYYSILIRDDNKNSLINYEWYIIPKDYYLFKIDKLTPKIGKKGPKKGHIVGWESKYCNITFSMSSQLWYKFDIKNIKKYKICSVEIDNSKPKIKYSQIFNLLNNTIQSFIT